MNVAANQARLSAVREDDTFDIGLRDAVVHDLDGGQQQALLKHLGGVGGGRTGDGAAHIRLVRYRARECDKFTGGKNRRDERHVGDVRQTAGIGMIGDEHVAVIEPPAFGKAAIELENAADEMPVDRSVEEHGGATISRPLRSDHAAEVA